MRALGLGRETADSSTEAGKAQDEPGTSCGTRKSKGHGSQLEGAPTGQIWDNLSKNNDYKTVQIHVFVIFKRKNTSRVPLEAVKAPPSHSANRK